MSIQASVDPGCCGGSGSTCCGGSGCSCGCCCCVGSSDCSCKDCSCGQGQAAA